MEANQRRIVMGKHLNAFIQDLEPELRVGGGATLDELYNLACALRADSQSTEQLATPTTESEQA